MSGYPVAEMAGCSVFDFLADTAGGEGAGAGICRAGLHAGDEFAGGEAEMRRKDGRPLWISLWMKPIRGEDGRVRASRSIWVDITDRVLAEAERVRLQQQNLYLQEEIKSAHNFEEIIGQSPAADWRSSTTSAGSPPPTPRCSSPARPAPAKS